jgi:plastocyanin
MSGQSKSLFISSLLIFCFISVWLVQNAHAQVKENGIIGQIIGNNKTQFYVSDVKVFNPPGSKSAEISIVFKNLGRAQQEFEGLSLRLVDTQSREYRPEISLFSPSSVFVPSEDTVAWKASFKIPSNNLSKIYYEPGLSENRLTVDLTKKMTPPEGAPKSSWNLSSNKGIKMSSRQVEVTINDERFEGKSYIIDTTLKNLGKAPLAYGPSNFMVKDESGVPYSQNIISNLQSPLLSGELPPGEQVRGDIDFDVDEPGKKMMIIYSGYSGIPFLNSGSSPTQNTSKLTSSNGTSVAIVLGSSDPNNAEFFVPESTTVSKGTSILWTNEDSTLHTVTSGSPEVGESGTVFDSSYLASGKTFEWQFNEGGTFDYYCTLHPFMQGVVIVK